MKCDECVYLNEDKINGGHCSGCSERPHELCCSDNFEQVETEVLTAEESMKINFFIPAENEGRWKQGFFDGFDEGKKQGRLEHDIEMRPLLYKIKKISDAKDGSSYNIDFDSIIDILAEFDKLEDK